ERCSIRLERGVVAGMQVKVVVVRHQDPLVAKGLVGVHRTLDPLGQADRLDPSSEPTGRRLEQALQEGLDPREDAHRPRMLTGCDRLVTIGDRSTGSRERGTNGMAEGTSKASGRCLWPRLYWATLTLPNGWRPNTQHARSSHRVLLRT